MRNQIFSQSFLKVSQNLYDRVPGSFKIRGVLVDMHDKNVKIDIGANKIMDIVLKDNIGARIGDTVVIEKNNIVKSKLLDSSLSKAEQEKSTSILKALQLPINSETTGALNTLDRYNISINKNTIQSFISIKKQLSKVINGLDYETAIKLIEKNVDIQKESLQKVAEEIDSIKSEKKSFKLSDLFNWKKEMKTDEAEKVSNRIYGSTMGKDILDTIKSLHKAGLEITKENVNKVNDLLHKVNDIQEIEEETLIDLMKNKIASTIEQLYKTKNNIIKGSIKSKAGLEAVVTKAYENTSIATQATDKDLRLLEEDIKQLLNNMEIGTSKELIALSKKLIKGGIEVSKDNIQNILDVKEAIKELKGLLTNEKAALAIKSDLEIGKLDIRDAVKELNKLNDKISGYEQIDEAKSIEISQLISALEKMDEDKIIELVKMGVDIKLETLGKIMGQTFYKDSRGINSDINYSLSLSHTIDKLRSIDKETLAYEINRNRSLTLEDISYRLGLIKDRTLEANNEVNSLTQNGLKELDKAYNSLEYIKENLSFQMALRASAAKLRLEGMELTKLKQFIMSYEQSQSQFSFEQLGETKIFKQGMDRVRLSEIIKAITVDAVAFSMSNKLPETIKSLSLSQQLLSNNITKSEFKEKIDSSLQKDIEIIMPVAISQESENRVNSYLKENALKLGNLADDSNIKSYIKSLLENNIVLNNVSLFEINERYSQLNKILEGIPKDLPFNLDDLLSSDIRELAGYIGQKQGNAINNGMLVEDMIKNISKISEGNKESLISLLMKNSLQVNLKEVEGLYKFLNNKEQLGAQINEIFNILAELDNKKEFKDSAKEFKNIIKELSNWVKSGKGIPEKPYEGLGKALENIDGKANLLDKGIIEKLKVAGEKLYDSLELQVKLNSEDTLYQMPYMFNDQMKNLQLYIMNNKKGGRRIDPNNMSLLLNFDTNNLGNLNIYVGINQKRAVMKFGVQSTGAKNYIERHKDRVSEILKGLGYELKDISFRVDEEQNILDMVPESIDNQQININKIDIKI